MISLIIALISTIGFSQTIKPTCPKGHNLFEGRCVVVPQNAIPTNKNPGWVCESGFQQKWMSCVKIEVPKHAVFLEDGKTWVCKNGYERYRGRCEKKKHRRSKKSDQ